MQYKAFLLLLAALPAVALMRAGEPAAPVAMKIPEIKPVAAGTPPQEIFQSLCVACHGQKGEGNEQLKAPAIAALPDWYVIIQLGNFREDRRGMHAEDVEGNLMRSISKILPKESVEKLAVYVSKLPRNKPQPVSKAEIAEGQQLFAERCMECHRFNAEGDLYFHSPPLVGQPEWYLRSQLKKFRTGMRGAAKDDASGQKMIFNSSFIESDEAMDSLMAYLMSLQQEKAELVFGK